MKRLNCSLDSTTLIVEGEICLPNFLVDSREDYYTVVGIDNTNSIFTQNCVERVIIATVVENGYVHRSRNDE